NLKWSVALRADKDADKIAGGSTGDVDGADVWVAITGKGRAVDGRPRDKIGRALETVLVSGHGREGDVKVLAGDGSVDDVKFKAGADTAIANVVYGTGVAIVADGAVRLLRIRAGTRDWI